MSAFWNPSKGSWVYPKGTTPPSQAEMQKAAARTAHMNAAAGVGGPNPTLGEHYLGIPRGGNRAPAGGRKISELKKPGPGSAADASGLNNVSTAINVAPVSLPSMNYQSGYNANRQAVNTGHIVGQLAKDSQYKASTGSQSGDRAVADLQKANQFNDTANLRRGLAGQNAQQQMQNQVNRSELLQAGLSNQSKVYADISQRENDQVGLAARLQEAMIRSRAAIAQALLSDQASDGGGEKVLH
jgi:hypothetical protein